MSLKDKLEIGLKPDAPYRPDGLAERAVGHDHVRPDALEDVALRHRLVPAFDEQDEQVEITGDERDLAAVLCENTARRRNDEVAEPVSDHRTERSVDPIRRSHPGSDVDDHRVVRLTQTCRVR